MSMSMISIFLFSLLGSITIAGRKQEKGDSQGCKLWVKITWFLVLVGVVYFTSTALAEVKIKQPKKIELSKEEKEILRSYQPLGGR